MYEENGNPYEPVQAPKKRGKKVLLVLLALVIAAAVALPLTSQLRTYAVAMARFDRGEYEAAAQSFAEIPGYKDADEYELLSRYRLAHSYRDTKRYLEAAEIYEVLGSYEDSAQYALECYYRQGKQAAKDDEWFQAIEYFTLAQDYADAAEERLKAIYNHGHALFLEGDYQQAQQYFQQLEGNYPDGTSPHFRNLEEAAVYLKQEAENLSSTIVCYIAEMPEAYKKNDALWAAMGNYFSFQRGTVLYHQKDLRFSAAVNYYPGERMVYAWRTGDDSLLSQEEKEVLELSVSLVEQAKGECETALELEQWLYDFLCRNVVYESPDMDVPDEEYLQLRQLNCLGALVDGKANCQGYTDAFYLLGTLAGLDVCKMTGVAEEPHCWNGVTIDGKLYITDVTFGDLDIVEDGAVNYINFNCGHDATVYEINGGAQIFPNLAEEDDLSAGYYGYNDCVFESLEDAADYLLGQYKKNGKGWAYAVVTDSQLTSEELYDAFDGSMSRLYVYSIRWTEVIEYYAGNTYFAICWN